MSSIDGRKYKDKSPLDTIQQIRGILHGLGLLTIEKSWNNSANGFYSVSIGIAGTDIGTNGKGTSYEYALASAYAELMERLQNQAFFRLNFDLSPEALKYKGFYYAPDEKLISRNEFINSQEDWAQTQLAKLDTNTNIEYLLTKWMNVSYEQPPADFVAIPFMNLKTKRLSYIPIKMVSKMYMSNGMCAGNTAQEALVQGISELLERYVNVNIIRQKITPPDIPLDYLKRYPRIEAMVNQIESAGNFKVILKDCSLNKSLPVVGALFINQDEQSYFVKFGSHPIFEIAAERTLTELLQGQNVRQMMGVKEYTYANLAADADNILGILVNGSGVYPAEFFKANPSYIFSEFEDLCGASNESMLNYLVSYLNNQGYSVYVRDASFLGFPGFQVLIPGLSEIDNFDDIKQLDDYGEYNRIKRIIRNLDYAGDEELNELVNSLNKFEGSDTPIAEILNLPVNDGMPWYYANITLYLTALHLKRGATQLAYKVFFNYLRRLRFSGHGDTRMTFFKCIRDCLGARVENLSDEEIQNCLSNFYSIEMIQKALNEFCQQKDVIGNYGQFRCWDCCNCSFNNRCLYKASEKIYLTLKDKYAANIPDQSSLSNLITG